MAEPPAAVRAGNGAGEDLDRSNAAMEQQDGSNEDVQLVEPRRRISIEGQIVNEDAAAAEEEPAEEAADWARVKQRSGRRRGLSASSADSRSSRGSSDGGASSDPGLDPAAPARPVCCTTVMLRAHSLLLL